MVVLYLGMRGKGRCYVLELWMSGFGWGVYLTERKKNKVGWEWCLVLVWGGMFGEGKGGQGLFIEKWNFKGFGQRRKERIQRGGMCESLSE